jgi:hypothetical protein
MSETMIDRAASVEARRDAETVGRLKGFSAFVLLVLAATSFTAGVPGLLDAGRWARLGDMAWLTPIAIDGGLVFFSASAMAWRAETARASKLGWLMVWTLSAVSVAAQIAHVLGDNPTPGVQDYVGAGVASMFPLLVLASTRQFEMLRFSRLIDREANRVAARDALEAPKTAKAKKPQKAIAKSTAKPAPNPPRGQGSRPNVTLERPGALPAGGPSGTALAQPAASTAKPSMALVGQARAVDARDTDQPVGEAEVLEWVRARVLAGERPSATTVGEMLGKSKASGLRLVNRVTEDLEARRGGAVASAQSEAWPLAGASRAG